MTTTPREREREPGDLVGCIVQLMLTGGQTGRGVGGFYRGKVTRVWATKRAGLRSITVYLRGGDGWQGRRVTNVPPAEILGIVTGKNTVPLAEWMAGKGRHSKKGDDE